MTAAAPAVPRRHPDLGGWVAEITISASGLEARIGLERRPGEETDGVPPGPSAEALRAELARAGVVHGIDEAALAQVAAAPAGRARVVARGEPARRGSDGVVVYDFLARARRDPLYTVPAGTDLARKTPPVPGIAGIRVTGEPIEPPPVRNPPLVAGPGAVALPTRGGGLRVVAGVDGRPVQRGGVVAVEQLITLAAIGVERRRAGVHCSLRVLDGISEGHRVSAGGTLTVGGMVDRSHLEAGAGISVGAGCVGSHLRAGGLDPIHRALLGRLQAAEGRLRALRFEAERLVAHAAGRGCTLRPGQALFALVQGHFADLPATIGECRQIARGPGCEGLDAETVGAIDAAHAALSGLGAHGVGSLEELDALLARLAGRAQAMAAQLAEPAGVRVNYLQRCRVEVSGTLVVTGRGIFNSHLRVMGDVLCEHPRGTIRGGRLHVGGLLRAPELGAPGGAPVEVVLEESAPAPERLVAGLVHEGVKVRLDGRWHVFSETRREVRLGNDEDGQRLVRHGRAG